jgi:hypothetical protein
MVIGLLLIDLTYDARLISRARQSRSRKQSGRLSSPIPDGFRRDPSASSKRLSSLKRPLLSRPKTNVVFSYLFLRGVLISYIINCSVSCLPFLKKESQNNKAIRFHYAQDFKKTAIAALSVLSEDVFVIKASRLE